MSSNRSGGFTACTIIARNNLPRARVLARSFTQHHPGQRLLVLIVDDPERHIEADTEPFNIVHLDELFPAEELWTLVVIYDAEELCAAVKPVLLQRALGRDGDAALFLDPDVEVFGSLAPIAELAAERSIVLTPHTLAPVPADGLRPSEIDILSAGVFNVGFLAVGRGAGAFLDWWWVRLRRQCILEPARMTLADQRWVDLAPSYFDHTILRDRTVNVAYWNLHERVLVKTDKGYEVDGARLTTFHFSGFSPTTPWLLTTHSGSDRVLLSRHPAAKALCRNYARKLEDEGSPSQPRADGWGTTPSAVVLNAALRREYRQAILDHENGQYAAPPALFDPDRQAEALAWLNEPVAGRRPWLVTRYLRSIYACRPDLQQAFPDLEGRDASRFSEWVAVYGAAEHPIPPALLPASPDPPSPAATAGARIGELGANVAGYLRAELGIGEAGRLLLVSLDAAQVPVTTFVSRRTISRQEHPFRDVQAASCHDINIFCVNADQTPQFVQGLPPELDAGQYRVGLWFWEVEQFPPEQAAAMSMLDEVWVASEFIADALRPQAIRPITTVPLPVCPPPPGAHAARDRLGLPEGYLFLYAFDLLSVARRKNPEGAIEAFLQAFPSGEGPVLVLKSINGALRLAELEHLRHLAGGRSDIVLLDGYLSAADRWSLLASCDCYVSLHRSEGFGLTMAEATAMGKPVIATGYSGNLSFMRSQDSFLVSYTLEAVPPGCEPYRVTARWAEPDLEQAAAIMRAVVSDPETAAKRGRAARDRVLAERSPLVTGAAIRQRLLEIGVIRARSGRGPAFP